jgi:CMP-N-acetylneuraminic acid synthetase/mannose-6-phosphate isomerase-like protein (cupin superfamily)
MKKIVAMIPALLGSTRIRDKNILLVDGYPLVFYVAKACKEAGVFDEIYINSEHDLFEKIAKMLDVRFYRRKPDRGGSACKMKNKSNVCRGNRCVVHDHFITDFLENISCDYLIQVHTTSPLIQQETIKSFVETLIDNNYDSLFCVEENYKEALLGGNPINFSKCIKTQTQDLSPLQIISWALSGWEKESYLKSYYSDKTNENGPTFSGNMGLFPINKIEALDADDWDDLFIIEACLHHQKKRSNLGKFKFSDRIIDIENDLKKLMPDDGIQSFEMSEANKPLSNIEEIKRKMGKPPWNYMLVYTDVDQVGIFCQEKGEGARPHCHVTKDEWWLVIEGSFDWILDNGKIISANAGEAVFLPKGAVHAIKCTSETPGIRIAFGLRDFEHIYVRK